MSGVSNFSPFVNVNTFKKIYKNTFTVNFSWSQCEISAGGGNSTAEYCIIICKGQIKIPLPLKCRKIDQPFAASSSVVSVFQPTLCYAKKFETYFYYF